MDALINFFIISNYWCVAYRKETRKSFVAPTSFCCYMAIFYAELLQITLNTYKNVHWFRRNADNKLNISFCMQNGITLYPIFTVCKFYSNGMVKVSHLIFIQIKIHLNLF